ncbi:hypothetical protein HG530_003458 [Fusarium avenaceum]|nr:hypothetical protein HG530_003458 [Fusarium avenaceum]
MEDGSSNRLVVNRDQGKRTTLGSVGSARKLGSLGTVRRWKTGGISLRSCAFRRRPETNLAVRRGCEDTAGSAVDVEAVDVLLVAPKLHAGL